jgi:hypothetical protein
MTLSDERAIEWLLLIAEVRRRGLEDVVEEAEEARAMWLARRLPLAAVKRLRDAFAAEIDEWDGSHE